jgi:flagellar motor switch protein FliM
MTGERLANFDPASARRFDFRSSEFLGESDLRQLSAAHTRFAGNLSIRLSTFLRMECAVKVVEFGAKTFAQFCETIASPSHVALFEIEPLAGVGLLEVRIPLGLAMSDRLLGGKGRATALDRSLTEIETALLDDVVHLAAQEWVRLCEAPGTPFRPHCVGHESSGHFLQTSSPGALMVVSSMDVTLGEVTEKVQWAVPFSMLDPMLRKFRAARLQTKEAPQKKLQWRPSYAGIGVPITAEWRLREMTLGEVMRMSEGQIIDLPRDLVAQTRVRFSNTEEFLGTVGIQNGHVAVQLTRPVQKD